MRKIHFCGTFDNKAIIIDTMPVFCLLLRCLCDPGSQYFPSGFYLLNSNKMLISGTIVILISDRDASMYVLLKRMDFRVKTNIKVIFPLLVSVSVSLF